MRLFLEKMALGRTRWKNARFKPVVRMDETGVRLCLDQQREEMLPWNDICAFGQATDWADIWKDDFWLVLGVHAEDGEQIVSIPYWMEGCAELESRLILLKGGQEPLGRLTGCIHPASVWFWPAERAGRAIWPDFGPSYSLGTAEKYTQWLKQRKLTGQDLSQGGQMP